MKSVTLVCTGPQQIILEERELPEPGPGMFLVKARWTAISTGTEMTLYTGDFPPGSVWANLARYPITLGYNHLGEVVALGEGVSEVQVGDRIAGWKNHAQYALYRPGDFWMKVPEGVPDEAAAIMALPVISLNGVRRAKVQLGESVVVFGLGPIGVWAAQFARLAGGRPVLGVDLLDHRRALAEGVGAVDAALDGRDSLLVEKVKEWTHGRLADVVFEVTGHPQALLEEFRLLRRQGRLVMLSSPRGPVPFDFHDLCNWPSYTIIGAHVSSHPPHENPDDPWTRRRNAELYFDLVQRGEVATKELITHRFPWREAPEAYRLLLRERGSTGIVLLQWE